VDGANGVFLWKLIFVDPDARVCANAGMFRFAALLCALPACVGAWELKSEVSDFTDMRNGVLFRYAEEPSCGLKSVVLVRCADGETSFEFRTACTVRDTGRGHLKGDVPFRMEFLDVRLDDEPPGEQPFMVTDDFFGWHFAQYVSEYLPKFLLDRERIMVRFTDNAHKRHTIAFDVSGLRDAMRATDLDCDWSGFTD
jgi:hypothetical protein